MAGCRQKSLTGGLSARNGWKTRETPCRTESGARIIPFASKSGFRQFLHDSEIPDAVQEQRRMFTQPKSLG